LLHTIREKEVEAPSTRISTLGDKLKTVCDSRRVEPHKLQASVRGEPDWIIMKALEKDRNRRYQTASDFAADIHRYLLHEPVAAGPPSVSYRLRKLLRRHRRVVAALAVLAAILTVASFVSTVGTVVTVAAALVLGTVVSLIGLVTAVRARNDAVQAKNDAVKARNHESAARKAVQEEVERNRLLLHVSEVSNAQQAWHSGNVEYALKLLRRQIPQPGEEDLRTIPWYFMWEQCHQYTASLSYDGPLHALAYSPARQTLAVAGEGALVALCDARTRRQIGLLPIEFSTVMSIAFSPDGTHLAVGGGMGFVTRDMPGNLEVWDWENRERVRVLEHGLSMVSRLAWSADGKTLAAGNYAGVVSVWDLESSESKPSRSIAAFEQLAWCLDFSPEGELLAGSWLAQEPLKRWDYKYDQPPASLLMPATVRSVAYSHDGRHLAIGLGDARRPIVVQERASGELRGLVAGTPVASICGEWCFVEAIVFSADDRRMFTANGKGSIEVYNMPAGERTSVIKGHTGGITGLCLLADGNTLVSCGHDRTVKFWDVEAALPSETYTRGHDWFTPWMAFSRDGGLLATSSMAGEVRVWDVATRRLKKELLPDAGSTLLRSRRMAFSPDGTKLAKADYHGTIAVWDLSKSDSKQILASDTKPLALEFSADGKRLSAIAFRASPDTPGMHQIMRFACNAEGGGLTGEPEVVAEIGLIPQTMPGGFPPYRYEPPPTDDFARLSHSGRLLAYLYANVVYLWDLTSGRRLTLAKGGHTEIIFGAAFSATDDLLATCSQDNSTRVWDTRTGTLVKSLPGRTWPLAVAFAPDGKTLFTGDVEGKITMWDLRTDKEILSLDADEDIITALALSPDGHTLASVSSPPSLTGFSGRIRLWQAPTAPHPTEGQRFSVALNQGINDLNGKDHNPSALGSELTLLDDFNNGHDDRWLRVDDFNAGKPWGPGVFDASAGAYHLSTTGPVPLANLDRFPPGDPAVFDLLNSGALGAIWRRSIVDRRYDNGVLRAKVRAGNVGSIVDLVVRAFGPSMYTFSNVASFQEFHFCRFDKGMLARVERMPGVEFNPRDDWWSEVRFEGEKFSWSVWKVGDDRPKAPQLEIRDATYSSGAIGVSASVFTNNIRASMPVDATFDDIYFMPISWSP
jgi:WD40 repeat protein